MNKKEKLLEAYYKEFGIDKAIREDYTYRLTTLKFIIWVYKLSTFKYIKELMRESANHIFKWFINSIKSILGVPLILIYPFTFFYDAIIEIKRIVKIRFFVNKHRKLIEDILDKETK